MADEPRPTEQEPTGIATLEPGQTDKPTGLLNLYHATPVEGPIDFSIGELGAHFAKNPDISRRAMTLSQNENYRILEATVDLGNVVTVPEQESFFNAEDLVESLVDQGSISPEQASEAYDSIGRLEEDTDHPAMARAQQVLDEAHIYDPASLTKQAETELLRPFLKQWGIDTIRYWNTYDAYGELGRLKNLPGVKEELELGTQPAWSYIVVDPERVRSVTEYKPGLPAPRPTEQATVPETSSERLIELRQAADPTRLPEIIHEPKTPRITPGRAFRGLGSLIGPGSKLKAVKRLFTLAQQGYQLLPEEYQLLGDVLDMEALTKPLPGTGVGLDYFRQMLGRVPPAPTSQEEREEPTGIATLEKSQEARRAYDEAMGITKNFKPTFEKLPGEWFLVEGEAEYAEGDIGEYNHEAIVRRNVLYKLADAANDFLDAGINLDDEYIDETTLEYIMAEQVEGAADPQAMMDKMGVTQKEIDVALGRSNATDYGIEELGYVRVAGNNLQLSGLTRSKMLEIANGLYDAVGDESIEGMTFNIEDSANGKFYKDVPFPVFSSGSMKALRDYDTAIVGMAEGGLVQDPLSVDYASGGFMDKPLYNDRRMIS